MSDEVTNDVVEKAATPGTFASDQIGGVNISGVDGLVVTSGGTLGTFDGPNAISPTGTRDGVGILSPDATNKFIDYIWDGTVLAKDGRRVTMRAHTAELSKINVGERLVRAAAQADATHTNAGAEFAKIEMRTEKVRLDWKLSAESLEDNIEGAGLEDHIVRMMTNQFANDLEDLAINGTGNPADGDFLRIMEGFVSQSNVGGHEVVATVANAGDEYSWGPETVRNLINALPRRYRALKTGYKLYADPTTFSKIVAANGVRPVDVHTEANTQSFLDGVSQVMGPAGVTTRVMGIPLVEVPYYPENRLDLTFPQNRVWGIQRNVQIGREYVRKSDTFEWTVFMRFAVAWEELDAMAYINATTTTVVTP